MSRILSLVAGLALSLGLSACVTVAPNALSAADTANLRFTSIEVRPAPAANIRWTSAEDEYLKSRNLSLTDPALTATPEARGFIEDLAARRLRAALERQLATRPAGGRPARIVATLRQAVVPSAAERVLVGGSPRIAADIDIVDARTGAVLTRYSGDSAMAFAGQGVGGVLLDAAFVSAGADDLYDRAANAYAQKFDAWLAPRS